MSFYRSKAFGIIIITFSLPLLLTGYYGIKIMTSVYNTDLGNGVVIYADDYVKTGHWVFDCQYSRLISREPLPTPLFELKIAGKIIIGNSLLNKADEKPAKEALNAITGAHDWYTSLRYLYSALDESSNLNSHTFYLIDKHAGRSWAVEVEQSIDYEGKSHFTVTIEPYDPETYVDYTKALKGATKSCPKPQ